MPASVLPNRARAVSAPCRPYLVFVCAALLLCVVATSARAQAQNSVPPFAGVSLLQGPLATTAPKEASASVAGTVLDLSGASVSGAEVTLLARMARQRAAWNLRPTANLIL